MSLRQAAQQALEMLEELWHLGLEDTSETQHKAAIDALRAALAEPEQEPAANKQMLRWVEHLKRLSDDGQHMSIPGLSSGACWELAIELEQFIKNTAPAPSKPQTTHWEGCEAVHPECRKPEQEPVGHADLGINNIYIFSESEPCVVPVGRTPIYTAPTPRKPLTWQQIEREWAAEWHFRLSLGEAVCVARWTEQQHGITGGSDE